MRTLVFGGCILLLVVAQAGAQCLGDFNGDGKVTVNELVTAVDNALNGCQVNGQRFVDNGDGTVSDTQTGLTWEKKDNLDGIVNLADPHDADNRYPWTGSIGEPSGTAFTDFLARLNDCESSDGRQVAGGFAGHCDWRLPTIAELLTIYDYAASGCELGAPCIFSALGPAVASTYWSSTSRPGDDSFDAWQIDFFTGLELPVPKDIYGCVRAVRGGS